MGDCRHGALLVFTLNADSLRVWYNWVLDGGFKLVVEWAKKINGNLDTVECKRTSDYSRELLGRFHHERRPRLPCNSLRSWTASSIIIKCAMR
jgi:hypothetical protein